MRRRRVCEKLALVPGKLDHATIAAFQVADRTAELAAYKVIKQGFTGYQAFFFYFRYQAEHQILCQVCLSGYPVYRIFIIYPLCSQNRCMAFAG